MVRSEAKREEEAEKKNFLIVKNVTLRVIGISHVCETITITIATTTTSNGECVYLRFGVVYRHND